MTRAEARAASRRSSPRFWIFSVRGMLVILAGLAGLLAAWRFSDENRDPDAAVLTRRLWDLREGGNSAAVRIAAVEVLGEAKEGDARRAVVPLLGATADADDSVRRAAVRALQRLFAGADRRTLLGPAFSTYVQLLAGLLDDRDKGVRAAAAWALGELALPRPGSPSWKAWGKAPRPTVGPDPRIVRAPLEGRLRDPEATVSFAALMALDRLIPDRDEADEFLLKVAAEEAHPVELRLHAIGLVQNEAPGPDPRVLEVLLALLAEQDAHVREAALVSGAFGRELARLGTAPAEAASALIRALRDGELNLPTRRHAASLMNTYVMNGQTALRSLVGDPDPVPRAVARAVLNLPPDAHLFSQPERGSPPVPPDQDEPAVGGPR